MSDLTTFRDHCRTMAEAQHKPECPSLGPKSRPVWEPVYDREAYPDDGIPAALRYRGHTPPPPTCDGCVTDAERALFALLAAEVDGYLDPHPTLWEDA